MKNLELLFLENVKHEPMKGMKKVVIHPFDNTKYVLSDDTIHVLENESIRCLPFDHTIADFEYVSADNILCIALENGSVYNADATLLKVLEEVSFCIDGIEKMQFSPDQEVVVFITRKKNVVLMNSQFDIICEGNLLLDEEIANKPITVGWGKEETQFQGLQGKKNIDFSRENFDLKLDEKIALKQEVHVSWREDSEFFALLFSYTENTKVLKIYNKQGILQHVSEKIIYLGDSLSWRPSGNWLAIPIIDANKYIIGLYEKNCLRHVDIVLPFGKDEENVKYLSWSFDSDILLVETIHLTTNKTTIYLFTMSNYKWSIKQTLKFDTSNIKVAWDPSPDKPKTLHVFLNDGTHLTYCWINKTHSSMSGIVALIDGKCLYLTDLKNTVTPPPMYTCKINLGNYINFASFSLDPFESDIFIVDAENQIHHFECIFSNFNDSRYLVGARETKTYQLSTRHIYPLGMNHFLFINKKSTCFVDHNAIIMATLDEKNIEYNHSFLVKNGNVNCLKYTPKRIVFTLTNGQIFEINEKQEVVEKQETLPKNCSELNITDFSLLFKSNRIIYIDKDKCASGVTSFIVSNNFLIYTLSDELKLVDLRSKKEVYSRQIESGSEIVTIIPEKCQLIMQMPRGNLECIKPRFLIIMAVGELLNAKNYEKAINIVRQERINFNIIVDHNPEEFMNNIDLFVNSISNTNLLELFVTELMNIDVTQTMYSKNYGVRDIPNDSNKISNICNRFLEILNSDSKHLQTMITCLVKKGDVEAALKVIWNIKDVNKNDTAAEKMFKYMGYLVDINHIFNIALGTYDFGLLLFVAERSQKDPKEYIPFIQQYNGLEENYKRFKIDCYLKRYEKALEHISVSLDPNHLVECLELIEKKELHNAALKIYSKTSNTIGYKAIALSFANNLKKKGKNIEASILFEKSSDLSSAIDCAKKSLDWKRFIRLQKYNNASVTQIKSTVEEIITLLLATKRYTEAAYICKTILEDSKRTADIFLIANMYEEALFENSISNLDMANQIKQHLQDFITEFAKSIENDYLTFVKHASRLKAIRETKVIKKQTDEFIDDDMYSDTDSINSSIGSRSSNKSSSSSKNRRKHEKKLLSLKEGNKYEEIAIISVLHKMVAHAFTTANQENVKKILLAAAENDLHDLGRILQDNYRTFIGFVTKNQDEIWTKEMMNSVQSEPTCITDNNYYFLLDPYHRIKPIIEVSNWEVEII